MAEKKPRITAALLPLLLALAACTPQHTQQTAQRWLEQTGLATDHQVRRDHSWVLPTQARIYLAYPSLTPLPPSGPLHRTQWQLSQAFKQQLSLRFAGVVAAAEEESVGAALKSARSSGQDFLLYPQLTAISANPQAAEPDPEAGRNHVQCQLLVFDTRSKRLLDRLSINSEQGYFDLSRQEPQRLFAPAVARALERLVGEAPAGL
jgi:hypothetical protein